MGNKTSVGNEKWSNNQVKEAYDISCIDAGDRHNDNWLKRKGNLWIYRYSLTRCHLPPTDQDRKDLEDAIKRTNHDSHWGKIAKMACRYPEAKESHDEYASYLQPLKSVSMKAYNKCLKTSSKDPYERPKCYRMVNQINKVEEQKIRDAQFVSQIEPLKIFSHGVYDRCKALHNNYRHNCVGLSSFVNEVEKIHIAATNENKVVHEKTLNSWPAKYDLEVIFRNSEFPKTSSNGTVSSHGIVQLQTNADLMTTGSMNELKSKYFRVHFKYLIPSEPESGYYD